MTTQDQITALKAALREAILSTNRVQPRRNIFGDTAEWTDDVKRWASLCDLDLSTIDPDRYFW